MEQLFVKDVNLARIANPYSQEEFEVELKQTLSKFNSAKFQRELLAIRNPNLGELQILSPIIKETCDNLLLDNNFAAIALTNMLFEAMIKFSLIFLNTDYSAGGIDKIHKDAIYKYDDNDLEKNINACKTQGYITKEDAKRLKKLARIFRHRFSHASFSKKISEVTNDGMMKFGLAPLENLSQIEWRDVKVADMPLFYMFPLKRYVDMNALGYFGTIMYYVEKLDLLITKQQMEKQHVVK